MKRGHYLVFSLFISCLWGCEGATDSITEAPLSRTDTAGIITVKISKDALPDYVPGQILLKIKGTKDVDSATSLLKSFSEKSGMQSEELEVVRQVSSDQNLSQGLFLIQAKETDVLPMIDQLQKMDEVVFAEPNYIARGERIPNDPFYQDTVKRVHLDNASNPLYDISAPQAWDLTTGSSDVVIAVIDTGVDYTHRDLDGRIWSNTREIPNNGVDDDFNGFVDDVRGWDFVEVLSGSSCADDEDCQTRDNDPMDRQSHGTHVSGLIAADTDNLVGIAGTCWNCKIMPVRAGWKTRMGGSAFAYSDMIDGVFYAANNGAKIINMSIVGANSQALKEALDYAFIFKDVVLFASAGNNSSLEKVYPAAYPNVIAVSSMNSDGRRSFFTSYGSWVDLASFGNNIYSTLPGNQYGFMSGTSMASPIAAGVAGLIRSYRPGLSAEDVRQILRTGATVVSPVAAPYMGVGKIDAIASLYLAYNGGHWPVADLDPLKIYDENPVYGNYNLMGTAKRLSPGGYYEIKGGAGHYPSSYQLLFHGTEEFNYGNLAIIDTTALAEGDYTFELSASNSSMLSQDRFHVVIDNAAITSPVKSTTVGMPTTGIEIRGRALRSNFSRYTIEYRKAGNPDYILAYTGYTPVLNGVLHRLILPSSMSFACRIENIEMRLTVYSNSASVPAAQETTFFSVDKCVAAVAD